MGSFYYTLNSDGSRVIHPHNHGGDFTVELHNTIDLVGAWEVALMEMTYFGQYFGNVLDDYGKVIISSTKVAVYPTSFIVDYRDAAKLFIEIKLQDIHLRKWYLHEILKFEKRRQYTWNGLKKAFKLLPSNRQSYVKFEVKENTLAITPIYDDDKTLEMEVCFSPFLAKLLKLEKESFKYKRDDKIKTFEVDLKQPETIEDDSIVLFTPDTMGDIWIKIDVDIYIRFPKLYCTVNTFNKMAFNRLFKFEIIREGNNDKWVMPVKYFGDKSYNATIHFSGAMQHALNVPHETVVYCGSEARSTIEGLKPKRAPEVNNSFNEITFKLNYNYYPTPKSLVEHLNLQCIETMYKIARMQHSEQDFEGIFVYRDAGDLVSYTAIDDFKVILSNHLLQVLKLPHTNDSITTNLAINLASAVRPFLHVYCNIIEPQLINDDEYPLLRVINNNANEDEKAMISFLQPQYHSVIRRYITSIRIYITDHINLDTLIFKKPISCLLHFRQR